MGLFGQNKILKKLKEKKILFLCVLALASLIVLWIGFSFVSVKVQASRVIQEVSVKNSGIVSTQQVKWTILVKRSQISGNQNLVKLPRGAKNVEIENVGADQANQILSQKIITINSSIRVLGNLQNRRDGWFLDVC